MQSITDYIKFKDESARLKIEFNSLKTENKHLYNLTGDLADYVYVHFHKDLIVTMIGRTKAEQDAIYAGQTDSKGRKYEDHPWKSPHQFGHAVDLRSKTFTKDEIKKIEDFLNAKYNPNNYYSWTARNHDIGLGDHFHIQFYKV